MAALIDGGGLRVSECCQLRVKDIDFDQGLVFVRGGKGDEDRSTLPAEVGRDELRVQLREAEALHRADREAGLAGVWPRLGPRTGADASYRGDRVTRATSAARVAINVLASDSLGRSLTMGPISQPSHQGMPRLSDTAWHST